MIFVKPRDGYMILDPHTAEVLPVAGDFKDEREQYWQRRLRDGDVVMATPPPPPPEMPADAVYSPEAPTE